MATTAEKPAAAGAAVDGRQPEEAQALFEVKHAELLSEARGVAQEFGVDVRAVAFRPDGAAVQHEFLGMDREARVRGLIRRAVSRDVSAMGLKELAEHERQLQALRAIVVRELQAKAAAKANAVAAAAGAKRGSEQQGAVGAGAGDNKIRRIDIIE